MNPIAFLLLTLSFSYACWWVIRNDMAEKDKEGEEGYLALISDIHPDYSEEDEIEDETERYAAQLRARADGKAYVKSEEVFTIRDSEKAYRPTSTPDIVKKEDQDAKPYSKIQR